MPPAPTHLTCEYHVDPLGIGAARPRLSWRLPVTHRGVRQAACELLVASDRERLDRDEGDLWQPGRVEGEQNLHVAYAGVPLGSRARCHWKVRTWDERGERSDWSEPARWELGLLEPGDWSARWIGIPRPPLEREHWRPGPLLRRAFRVEGPLVRARLYASGLGLYRASLNGGAFASEAERPFAPGWTDYHHRVQHQTYDVTAALREGENAIGVALGEGWYAGLVGNVAERGFWGSELKALVQLELDYADGRREVVCSDGDWQGTLGPLVVSDLMAGEIHDARAERPEWDRPGPAADGWEPVRVLDPPRGRVVPERGRPTRRLRTLAPVARTAPTHELFVYDFGQEIAGRVRLTVQGPAGTEIVLRHGERLAVDGTVYTANLRRAFSVDRYVLKGEGVEVWEPAFAIHGFRYVELWGWPGGDPPPGALEAVALGADLEQTGSFACSNEDLERLHEAIAWTHRGNALEVPTDNQTRNERNGWLADGQVFARTASLLTRTAPFYEKWLDDVRDGTSSDGAFPHFAPTTWPQEGETRGWRDGGVEVPLRVYESSGSPGWGNAGVLVPWEVHQMTGDVRVLEEQYDAMVRWVELLMEENPDLIWRNRVGNDYGDWLSFPQADSAPASPRVPSVCSTSPKAVLATAFLCRDADLVACSAAVLGRDEDAARFEALAAEIRAAYAREFLDADGRIAGGTQTTYAQALRCGLVPEELRERAVAHLVEEVRRSGDHVSTGILGTLHLLPALASAGEVELAYRLLLNEDVPSWLHMIRHGATTIWERWDGVRADGSFQDVQMNSFNQPPLGAVGEWLYEGVAGIAPDPRAPGFRRFLVHPRPGGGLTAASATHVSPHGEIRCAWTLEGERFALELEVPAGTTATVRLPASADADVREGSQAADAAEGVRLLERGEREAAYEVVAGSYRFVVA